MLKAFLFILLLAGGLRFTALTFDSLWLDESYQTVVESYGNALPDLFNLSANPVIYKFDKPASIENVLKNFRKVDPLCPPLFAIIMNRWLTIFGGSDFTLRSFSTICSILSIVAIYFFGSSLLGKRAGIYAALLQTISPFDINYAQEARMYSLCTLLATLASCSLLHLCVKERSSKSIFFALIYILSTWALINTHYTQIFLWAFAIGISFVIAILRKDWLLTSCLVLMNICVLALCLPWVPLFLQAAGIRTASFYVARQPSSWWPIWALLVRIPFNWLTFLSGKKVMLWAAPVYLTSSLILAKAILLLFDNIKTKWYLNLSKQLSSTLSAKNLGILLFLWALFPALMIWALDVLESHRVIEISRYLISTAPAIFLLGGFALSNITNPRLFFSLVFCHSSFCLANNAYLHIVPQKEDWRKMAQLIENKCHPNEIIFVSNYYNIVCLDRYLNNPLRQIGISPSIGPSIIEKTIVQEKNNSNQDPVFWILAAQEGDAIFNTISSQYKMIGQYDFPHALHLRQYKAEYSTQQ